MTEIGAFVISVVSAVMITGILQQLIQDPILKSWLQILSGIYVTVILLMNIRSLKPVGWRDPFQENKNMAQYYMEAGKSHAQNSLRNIITHNIEAYILDKATQLGISVTVSVSVSADDIPKPESVTLSGQISPYEKSMLCKIISEDLGIPREDQIWIG